MTCARIYVRWRSALNYALPGFTCRLDIVERAAEAPSNGRNSDEDANIFCDNKSLDKWPGDTPLGTRNCFVTQPICETALSVRLCLTFTPKPWRHRNVSQCQQKTHTIRMMHLVQIQLWQTPIPCPVIVLELYCTGTETTC